MKRIAYSFLLIALLSCGASRDTEKRSHFVIKMRDSVEKEFLLLSVRSDTLIVSPYDAIGIVLPGSLIGSAETISFSRIERIYIPHIYNGNSVFWGGFAGCFLGGCIGSVVWMNANQGSDQGHLTAAPYIGIALGIPAGMLVGYLMQSGDSQYSLSSELDINILRKHAFFQTEPPELQKIK